MTRLPAFAADIRALFSARGATAAEVAIVQPADPFLDIAGEDLRRRIFLTESETGEQLCLRPEFTIPVCLDHIASNAATPRRYSYIGEVFRQRRDGRPEFFQAGIEDLGDLDFAAADARSIGDAHALLRTVLPGRVLAIVLGDQSLFEAVLAALGLPRGWRMRLARAFGSPEMLEAALADLGRPSSEKILAGPTALLVADSDEAALVEHIAEGMHTAGIPLSAGRTPEEIARRLIEKVKLASVRLSPEAFDALRQFLSIRVPLDQAGETLSTFAESAGLALGDALSRFSSRLEALRREDVPLDKVTYDAAFGRPLDYYTGLVFEIVAPDVARPLAGGGRYDRLLTMLGAKQPIPGVGFSVWLDRIEALRAEQ
ncbi:MAG: ATP phosphoribosyltransferase regulatory subunit [Rhizobiaceae bacterium]|nr:ATP phosphoribosyltransferase regulatory subunit [Rhizobiaceae bacterium]